MGCVRSILDSDSCVFKVSWLTETISLGLTAIIVTGLTLSILGLTASANGPFSGLVGLGAVVNAPILGVCAFAAILHVAWNVLMWRNEYKRVAGIQLPNSSSENRPVASLTITEHEGVPYLALVLDKSEEKLAEKIRKDIQTVEDGLSIGQTEVEQIENGQRKCKIALPIGQAGQKFISHESAGLIIRETLKKHNVEFRVDRESYQGHMRASDPNSQQGHQYLGLDDFLKNIRL